MWGWIDDKLHLSEIKHEDRELAMSFPKHPRFIYSLLHFPLRRGYKWMQSCIIQQNSLHIWTQDELKSWKVIDRLVGICLISHKGRGGFRSRIWCVVFALQQVSLNIIWLPKDVIMRLKNLPSRLYTCPLDVACNLITSFWTKIVKKNIKKELVENEKPYQEMTPTHHRYQ